MAEMVIIWKEQWQTRTITEKDHWEKLTVEGSWKLHKKRPNYEMIES